MEGRARQERKNCLLDTLAAGENHIKCEAREVDIFQLMLLDVAFRMYENVKNIIQGETVIYLLTMALRPRIQF